MPQIIPPPEIASPAPQNHNLFAQEAPGLVPSNDPNREYFLQPAPLPTPIPSESQTPVVPSSNPTPTSTTSPPIAVKRSKLQVVPYLAMQKLV